MRINNSLTMLSFIQTIWFIELFISRYNINLISTSKPFFFLVLYGHYLQVEGAHLSSSFFETKKNVFDVDSSTSHYVTVRVIPHVSPGPFLTWTKFFIFVNLD